MLGAHYYPPWGLDAWGWARVDATRLAEGYLPFYLLSRFHNVLTTVQVEGGGSALRVRNVELYYSKDRGADIYIPGASSLLSVRYISSQYTAEPAGDGENEVTITGVEGSVLGFIPSSSGRFVRYTERAFGEDVVGVRVKVRGEPDQYTVDMAAGRIAKLEAGRRFAANVKAALNKEGWKFEQLGRAVLRTITVAEGRARAELTLYVRLFKVARGGREVTAPGVIPGVLAFFEDDGALPIGDGRVKDVLIGAAREIAEVGSHFTSLALLQSTSSARFTYIVGEARVPKAVREDLMKKGGGRKRFWLAGGRVARGARVDFYLDLEGGKVPVRVALLPQLSSPAIVALNFPPFDTAVLAAVVHDAKRQLGRLAEQASRRLERFKAEGAIYVKELEPLAEAGVAIEDVRRILREGYPRLDSLMSLVRKMDRVSYLGDVVAMTYGEARKVEELLISSIKPAEERREAEGRRREQADIAL